MTAACGTKITFDTAHLASPKSLVRRPVDDPAPIANSFVPVLDF